MPPKRRRRASPLPKGLAAGEQLRRNKQPCNDPSELAWVGTQVSEVSNITLEHRLTACGLSRKNKHPHCANKYALKGLRRDPSLKDKKHTASGELQDDIIVISDDDEHQCSKKLCKNNPYCLNYLGQDQWEGEDDAREAFLKAAKLGENPVLDARDPDLPVGLKNLGATCYANAFLQVWFRDIAFRSGVYRCQPSQDTEHKFEESPIFQLQVTFAALQESTQAVFNPTKLVESLQLRTSEQQDAQEFSKLFMSHLDIEFQKQSISSLRSLLADQFQGKQVYGTICETCGYRSERMSDFLEIEINFENNAKLDDCIAAMLQPETLSGDNKYLCAQCSSLQDATRYTELRELPPVLHFSLLRFVYDFSSMERKKSKHTISFSTTIDMNRFLGDSATRKSSSSSKATCRNVYELRGVLLHKGTSAYHGHYEAQVFDVTRQSWFQFNDETVTNVKTLGDKQIGKTSIIDVENNDSKRASSSKGRTQRANKRRRIDDSDDDVVEVPPPSATTANGSDESNSNLISSKHAYMLIYTRKEDPHDSVSAVQCSPQSTSGVKPMNGPVNTPTPPLRALEVVNALNAAHDEACDVFTAREKEAKRHFDDMRQKVMDIYRSWNVPSYDEKCVVVSQQALETWLSLDTVVNALNGEKTAQYSPCCSDGRSRNDFGSPSSEVVVVPSGISCTHGCLNPWKAGSMKCISEAARDTIFADTHYAFHPNFSLHDVCKLCVESLFTERLYQIEHPRLVNRFDLCEADLDSPGYWISKDWLKDWRLVRPKMHMPSLGDPSPDSTDFNLDVRCEHGGLSMKITARRRISLEASQILKDIFPDWDPISTDSELCAVCDALVRASKGDKREIRRRAEDEKAKLRHMHDNALNGNTALLENVPCAIVPAQFVRSWRQWLLHPADINRPDNLDNSIFICEHSMLVFDPNSPNDLDTSIGVIKRSDWDILEELYSGGPLISLEKCLVDEDGAVPCYKFVHDIPICTVCRQKRKSDYEITDITVRIAGPGDALPRQGTSPPPVLMSASRKATGSRHSKRLRQVKEHGEKRKLTVTKMTTVKEIKVTLQDELNIPTICQRLFYHGKELEDSSASVESLGILANDVLHLREETESDDRLDSDEDVKHTKKRRQEERGFSGTLLGGTKSDASPDDSCTDEKTCPACTFANPFDATFCGICDTSFN